MALALRYTPYVEHLNSRFCTVCSLDAWSSMLAIVTMRAGRRPCWARCATISGLLIGTVAPDFVVETNCLKRAVSGVFQLVVGAVVFFRDWLL